MYLYLIFNVINLYINQAFIKLMNKLLSDNESTSELLKQFAFKNFYLKFGIINILFTINEQGLFCNSSDKEDVKIYIPYNLFNYFIDNDKIKFIQKIKIEGSTDLAIRFLEIISSINISYIFNKGSIYGLAMNIIKILISLNYNFYKNTFSYFQYEKNQIVSKNEINIFCEEVDIIKNKCDFLENNIKNFKL